MHYFIGILLVGGLAYWLWRKWSKTRRRAQLRDKPLSAHQREIVADQVPIFNNLPDPLQAQLEGRINLFLDQVSFSTSGDLEMTEEMQLSVAAQACLLIINSDVWYDNLTTIILYPTAFKSKQVQSDGYIHTETEVVRIGESWTRGPVVLSWAHSDQGGRNFEDGHNVVLHEFAHQLDDLTGRTNGVPVLSGGQTYAEWERVFVAAYTNHVENVEKRRKTVLDAYGAQDYQEFFAVAIEVFFEKPARLHDEEPEVYHQLSELLRIDPRAWH